MKIGNLILEGTPLFLAPMEDVTYKSFRWMCKKYGADVMYTEFVSSEALVRDVKKTKDKMVLFGFDRPAAIQIYGHNISSMVHAAEVAEEVKPDFIDLNFGCPMKKIIRHGAGAALMKDLPKMQQMAREVVKAVKIPITAKTRLGWSLTDKTVVEAALRLQDAGVAAIAIHGRTRDQLYKGSADWTLIGEVKNHPAIKIPVIGNGDITSGEKAKSLLEQSGVDGLMIGRAAIGRPWIFREIKHYLQTGETLLSPLVSEVVENVRAQLQLNIEWKESEKAGIMIMRRHFARYFPGLPHFRDLRIRLLRAETINEVNQILDEITEQFGSCRPDYNTTD
jgi:tRNA-dihydrouridine synthase B